MDSETHTVAAVRDVTERKRIEQRAQQWQKAQEEIRQRDTFIAVASRELHGPLGVLRQQLAALQCAADQLPGGSQAIHTTVRTSQRETRHLVREIARAHGGVVDVCSRSGKGTSFAFEADLRS